MAVEKIAIQAKGQLTVAKTSKRTYFTVDDMTQKRYICWNPGLYNEFEIGKEYPVNVTPSKTPEGSPVIESIVKEESIPDKEAVVIHEAIKATITDTKNRGFALSYAKDLAVAGKIELNKIGEYARIFEKYLNGEP